MHQIYASPNLSGSICLSTTIVRTVILHSTSWHIYRGTASLRFTSSQPGPTEFRAINHNEGSWTHRITRKACKKRREKSKTKSEMLIVACSLCTSWRTIAFSMKNGAQKYAIERAAACCTFIYPVEAAAATRLQPFISLMLLLVTCANKIFTTTNIWSLCCIHIILLLFTQAACGMLQARLFGMRTQLQWI